MDVQVACPKCGFLATTTVDASGTVATCDHCGWGGAVEQGTTVVSEQPLITVEMWADALLTTCARHVAAPLAHELRRLGLLPAPRRTPMAGKDSAWLQKHNEICLVEGQELLKQLFGAMVPVAFTAGQESLIRYQETMGHPPPRSDDADNERPDIEFGG